MIDAAMISDIEEIKQLKARYFYHLDRKEWDDWRESVFCHDASMHVPEAQLDLFGIDDILSFLRTFLAGVVTVHHGHMPIIQILSPTTASGIWAMEDVLILPTGRHSSGVEGRVHGYGHYHETYSRESGGWRIKTLRLTRLLGPAPLLGSVS